MHRFISLIKRPQTNRINLIFFQTVSMGFHFTSYYQLICGIYDTKGIMFCNINIIYCFVLFFSRVLVRGQNRAKVYFFETQSYFLTFYRMTAIIEQPTRLTRTDHKTNKCCHLHMRVVRVLLIYSRPDLFYPSKAGPGNKLFKPFNFVV